MKKLSLHNRTLPKWMILFIDLVIMIWSFYTSILMMQPSLFISSSRHYFVGYLLLYSLISCLVFYFMGIPKGIMRYSNIQDLSKLFISLLVIFISFEIFMQLAAVPLYHLPSINQTALIVNFTISSTILLMCRIAVKRLFSYILQQRNVNIEHIVIYGSDKPSILIMHAIEASGKFQVAGFVEHNSTKIHKLVEQKKVFNIEKLWYLEDKLKVTKLLIINDKISNKDKIDVITRCFEHGVKVVTLPTADDLLNGELKMNQIRDLNIDDLLQREPILINTDNILKQVNNKTILITGAAGSIGSEIVRQVLKFNPGKLILCDQAESPLHELQLELEETYPNLEVCLAMASIQNHGRMRVLFNDTRPNIVFHAAAYKHVPLMECNPAEAVLANVLGTKNLADLSAEFGVEKFVMISTDKAINPTNVMGAAKRIAELYIQSLHKKGTFTKFITTRFGNVLGSNGSVIPRFQNQIRLGGPVTVTHPDISRYFMTIIEAVRLVMEASAIGNGGEILIFDMGTPVKIVDLARQMIAISGFIPDKDIKIAFTGLRPGEKLYEEILSADELSVPTHHPKIRISIAPKNPEIDISTHIDDLLLLVNGNNYDIVRKMKEAVPEFVSNNSVYEVLDSTVKRENAA